MGFPGLLMLKIGLLTISVKGSVYKCENDVPDWESLNKILRNQKIVAQSYAQSDRDFYGRTTFDKTLRLGAKGYIGRFYFCLCLFLTGCRESITFKSEDGDEAKVVLNNYPDYDLHRNIFAGIDFSRDILTTKDNLQMVTLLLDNKLLTFVKWTTEERNEKLKEQLMEMFFESGNYATKLLFKLIKTNEKSIILENKDRIMKAISQYMANMLNQRRIKGYGDSQDTIKQSLEDLIGDKEKECGEVYFWMEVEDEYKPIPISINEDYFSKFRTPKIRVFKHNTLNTWGITQTKFDKYIKKKINDFYMEYTGRPDDFIKWLQKEKHFYLYGRYIDFINDLFIT